VVGTGASRVVHFPRGYDTFPAIQLTFFLERCAFGSSAGLIALLVVHLTPVDLIVRRIQVILLAWSANAG
jgi:hypothetical protein